MLIVFKWQILLLSFFSKHEWEQQSGKNFENVLLPKQNNVGGKSVAHIKLTFSFQIQVHGIEKKYRGSKVSFGFSCPNENIIKLMYTVEYIGPR